MATDEIRAVLALMEEAQKAKRAALAAVKAASATKAAAQADLDAVLRIHGETLAHGPPALPTSLDAELTAVMQGVASPVTPSLPTNTEVIPDTSYQITEVEAVDPPHDTPAATETGARIPPHDIALNVQLALMGERDIVIEPLTLPAGRSPSCAVRCDGGRARGVDDEYLREHCASDYLALCRVGDVGHADQLGVEYTDGRLEGEALLKLPGYPGTMTCVTSRRVMADAPLLVAIPS